MFVCVRTYVHMLLCYKIYVSYLDEEAEPSFVWIVELRHIDTVTLQQSGCARCRYTSCSMNELQYFIEDLDNVH